MCGEALSVDLGHPRGTWPAKCNERESSCDRSGHHRGTPDPVI
jgi:hypothetical protein